MENKPKYTIDQRGTKYWHTNSHFHREDGPAIIRSDGTKEWYINGKCHRLDGPAYIGHDGVSEWFINDSDVTDKITTWATNNNIDLDNLSEVDKALIKIVWADYGK